MNAQIKVNADLFRIAAMCQSTEETRYYLQGVYVEPHAVAGVNLVTTDGHRLLHVYDENGRAERPAIIRLGKDALKACKKGKYEIRRELHVEISTSLAQVFAVETDKTRDAADNAETLRPVAIESGCIIDGTFPDYRRVVPANLPPTRVAAGFNGILLGHMGAIGKALHEFDSSSSNLCMVVHAADAGGPALIRWPGIEIAYGVLMPMRASSACDGMPAFFDARPKNPMIVESERAQLAA